MNLSPLAIQKFFDSNGAPLVGGKLFTYVSGTSTKQATYTSSTGLSSNTNPVILDYRGECRLWIDPELSYTFVLAPATDTDPPGAPIWTVNDITAAPANSDNAAVDTGSVNNVSLSIPSISSPVAFTRVVFQANHTNTGPMTLQINGGTAKNLRYQNTAAFAGGEILAGGIYEAVFDGTQWQLQGPAVAYWRTPTEVSAGVTPTNYQYPQAEHLDGDVRRINVLLSQGDDFGPYLQDAIDSAPYGGVVTIPASGSLYLETSVNIPKAIELRGNNRRYSDLIWAGSSGIMLTTSDGASCDNLYLHDFEIGNTTGSACTALISVNALRAKLTRIFSNIVESISSAAIRTDPSATVYRVTIDGCDLGVASIAAVVPYLVYYPRGHSLNVSDSFFNGFATAGVKIGDGTNSVQGAFVGSSRFETGDGIAVGYPGSATAIGIDVTTCDGFTSVGNNFEMVQNASGSASGQRAITLRTVKGASITGGYMSGNGIADALIELASSNALGVSVGGGLGYASLANPGYLLTTSGGGLLTNAEVGNLYRNTSNTVGHYDNSFTPTITFGNASTGITYGTRIGKWSRVGNWILFEIIVILTSKGSSTGTLRVEGLPATSIATTGEQPSASVFGSVLNSITGSLQAIVRNGEQKIQVFFLGTGTITELTDTHFNNTSELHITGKYLVA